LSENAEFAEQVRDAGLVWVGAPPAAIRAMGVKDAAKARMTSAGVPTTPGYLGQDQDPARLQAEADQLGYPVLIKAVAGGGGKGMRRVDAAGDFQAALAAAQREAAASFGDDRVLIEIYVARPRHIEVQVFGDRFGEVVHLFERDCSLQRRHQKVIEEAPAPGLGEEARASVVAAAVAAARAVAYEGAGTVEFIADASDGLRADRIWFMEMNTRLQVEHPVTEGVTGLDLVEWQLRIADGQPLPLRQDQITQSGWSMQARLYAENPQSDFLPSTGRLEHLRLPAPGPQVRIDSGVEEGGEISLYYDPLIAKIIVTAPTRASAARRLRAACAAVQIWPVRTNAGFLVRCLSHPTFLAGDADTGFIAAEGEALTRPEAPRPGVLQAAAQALIDGSGRREPAGAWNAAAGLVGFRINADAEHRAELEGPEGPVWASAAICEEPPFPTLAVEDGVVVFDRGDALLLRPFAGRRGGAAAAGGSSNGVIISPMPGRIVSVLIAEGQAVARGDVLVVLEAMKMEHALSAPFDGVVSNLQAAVGDQVVEGAALVHLAAEA
jgi:acetyl/propionyl-CoA carboxylase alpha subunit